MKYTLFLIVSIFSISALAKDVQNFHKALVQDVQKSIQSDNDQSLKTKEAILRGPASVEEDEASEEEDSDQVIEEDNKIEKNFRQIGPQKW